MSLRRWELADAAEDPLFRTMGSRPGRWPAEGTAHARLSHSGYCEPKWSTRGDSKA